MRDHIENLIRRQWSRIFPKIKEPRSFQYLLRSGFRKSLVVVFADHGVAPIGIGYYTAENVIIERLKRQHDALSIIHNGTNDKIKKAVPRPLLFEKIDTNTFLFLENVPGKPLDHYLRAGQFNPKIISGWSNLTKSWVLELNRGFSCGQTTIEELMLQRDSGPQLKKLINGSVRCHVPLVLQHGDFQPSNILIERNGIACVDWEYSKIEGLPLYDIFYFLAFLYKGCHLHEEAIRSFSSTINNPQRNIRVPSIDDLRMVFFTQTSFSEIYRTTILDYCCQLGMEPAAIKPLFYLFVLEFKGIEAVEKLLVSQDAFINLL